MTLIEALRKELVTILNGASTDHITNDEETCFKSVIGQKSIFYPNEVAQNYSKALRLLRALSNQTNNPLSDKKIEHKLDNFIIELKYSSDQGCVKREIDKHILRFIDSIKQSSLDKFLFLLPIMNLKLESSIQIGDSSLVIWTPELIQSLEKEYSIKFGYPQLQEFDPEKQLPKCNGTETYALITVEAPDDDRAIELAIQKAETCLNVLRVYSDSWTFVLRGDLKKSFGVRLVKANLKCRIYGECALSINLHNNFMPTTVDKKGLEYYNSKIRPLIDPLLRKKACELNSLEEDILTAILWFGSAVKDDDKRMRFVKGIMALESLLVPNGGSGKCGVIAKNFTRINFSGSTTDQKRQAFKEMRDMYLIRNSIIHSGEGYVYEEDLTKMLVWVRTTLQILLEKGKCLWKFI